MRNDKHLYNLKTLTASSLSASYTTEQRRIIKAVEDALYPRTKDVSEKVKALRNTVKRYGANMDSSQYMLVFKAYKDLGRFNEMISLYEKCPNEDFTKAPLVRELLCLAYNKTNQPEKAVKVASAIVRERKTTSLTYETESHAFRKLAAKEKDEVQKGRYLAAARKITRIGFEETLDYSLGIRAARMALEEGKTDEAHHLATMAYLATMRDGAEESFKLANGERVSDKEYWLITNALEAACLSKQSNFHINRLMQRLENCYPPKWQLNDTLDTFEKLERVHPVEGSFNSLAQVKALLLDKRDAADYSAALYEISDIIPYVGEKGKETLKAERKNYRDDTLEAKKIDTFLKNDVLFQKSNDKNIKKIQKKAADAYSEMVRANVLKSNNYFALQAMFEASLLVEVDVNSIQSIRDKFLETNPPIWAINNTKKFLDDVVERGLIDARIISDIKALGETFAISMIIQQESLTEALHNTSYSYRGAASHFEGTSCVSGNMQFGGQLPDHAVSKRDIDFFTQLLAVPLTDMVPAELLPEQLRNGIAFNEIKDVELFLRAADALVRYRFGNDNFSGQGKSLEENALMRGSDGKLKGTKGSELVHGSVYDRVVSGLIHDAGKSRGRAEMNGIASRTNISAIFALGIGDCRHHAQAKQLIFDMWQKQQMNEAMRAYYRAKDAIAQNKALDDFKNIYLTELRTTDVQVKMNVKMEQWTDDKGVKHDCLYRPELTEDGKFQKGTATTTLEEHTLTMLMRRNESGSLLELGLRDAFYQHTYNWGHYNISIDDIHVDNNGKPLIPAGSLRPDEMADEQPLEITLEPTVYNTGKRDFETKDSTGNDIRVMGLPTGIDTFEEYLTILKKAPNAVAQMKILSREKKREDFADGLRAQTEKAVSEKTKTSKSDKILQQRMKGQNGR